MDELAAGVLRERLDSSWLTPRERALIDERRTAIVPLRVFRRRRQLKQCVLYSAGDVQLREHIDRRGYMLRVNGYTAATWYQLPTYVQIIRAVRKERAHARATGSVFDRDVPDTLGWRG